MIRKSNTYRGGRIIAVKADVLGRLRPRLLSLEEQLPDLFVRHAKESLQGPWPFRIELPHMGRPALAGEDPAEEHHLNHVSETSVLVYYIFYARFQNQHFVGQPPVQTLVGPRREPH